MTQNSLALIIVFLSAGITVYSVVRSLTSKKGGSCSGCTACSTNTQPKLKIKPLEFHQDIKKMNMVIDPKRK